jgi:hypothetical protein
MKLRLKFDSKTLKMFYDFICEISKSKPTSTKGILFNFYIAHIFAMYSILDDQKEKDINYDYLSYDSGEPLTLLEYSIYAEDGIFPPTIKEYQISLPEGDVQNLNPSLYTLKMDLKEFENMKDYISGLLGKCQSVVIKVKTEKKEGKPINLLSIEGYINETGKRNSSFEVNVRKIVYHMNHINNLTPNRILTVEISNLLFTSNIADKFKSKYTLNKVNLTEVSLIIHTKFNIDGTISLIFLYDTLTCEVLKIFPVEENKGWETYDNLHEKQKKNLYFKIQMQQFIDVFITKSLVYKTSLFGFEENYLSITLMKSINSDIAKDVIHSSFYINLPSKLISNVKDVKEELKNNESLLKINNID